jgi:hypothetical protein
MIDSKAIKAHLQTVTDITDDDGYESSEACRGLQNVQRIFYGTPYEHILDDAMQICNAVSNHVEGHDNVELDNEWFETSDWFGWKLVTKN